jgi:DNA-binding LacI/PurR family transcriptional regulator
VNARGYVGEATRRRVNDAMSTLGYRPNSAARALRSGRFRTIGVIMFTLASYGNNRTLNAIAARAARAGYTLTLLPVESATRGTVTGAFHRLREHAVDGIIIIIETHDLDGDELEVPGGVPVVVVDSTQREAHAFVDTDQAQGARAATEHLLELGHATVWHVAGPEGSYSAQRRRDAWSETLESHGRTVPPVLHGDWSARSGFNAAERLLEVGDATAVFTANDEMAIGLLRALRERGLDVPRDMSIVGFDDAPDAEYIWPPLTTVRQNFEAVGESAIDALLAEIDGTDTGAPRLISTDLIVRESTAPPRA